MKKTIVCATVAMLAVGQPMTAYAGNGGAIAAGIIGGLALGALAASAAQQHPRYYYVPRHRVVHHYVPRPVVSRHAAPRASLVSSESVPRDEPSVLRAFWNCGRYGRVTVTGKARNGFIRSRASTRYVCGNPDYPVVEFEYAPSPSSGGFDEVTFMDRGRVLHVDNLTLDPTMHVVSHQPPLVTIAQDGEKVLWKAWNCEGQEPVISAFARTGFTNVRDGTANVCGSASYPVKEIVYRASGDYTGDDTVMIRSAASAPVNVPIEVISKAAMRAPAAVPAAPSGGVTPAAVQEAITGASQSDAKASEAEDIEKILNGN